MATDRDRTSRPSRAEVDRWGGGLVLALGATLLLLVAPFLALWLG